jgi:hypothetical protein
MHPSSHDPLQHQPHNVQYQGAQPVPLAPYAAQPYPTPALPVDDRARNAAIALCGAAVLLLVGLISHAWFTARGDGGVGLLGVEECRRAMCRSMNWFDIPRAPAEVKLFSTIGIIGLVGAIGFLAQAALMLFRREAHRVMMVPLNAALGIAAFGCFSFFFHLTFGELSRRLSVSYAGILAMAGIIGASIVIGTMVRPLAKRAAANR